MVGSRNTNVERGVGITSPLIDNDDLIVNKEENDNRESEPFHGFRSFNWSVFWKFCGPGWLMSIAYLDPGNIEADLQQGVVAGYSLLWILALATCIGLLMQVLAARLGTVTGKQLAEVCREEYSKPVSVFLWIMTEIAIIGSDIQEVVGSAIALQVLFNFPLWLGVSLTAIDSFLFLALEQFGVRKLESFFIFLVAAMAISFGYVFFASGPNWGEIAYGTFVPTLSSDQSNVNVAVGMVGAVVMPHNIYLHSALVRSRHVDRKNQHRVSEANFYFAFESALALFCSFLINLFVVAVFARTYHLGSGHEDDVCNIPDSAGQLVSVDCSAIGLNEAGGALSNILGSSARIVWGIGLLASGQSSTMTGTYAGQFVMEGFLNLQVSKFQRTLITRSVALVPAMLVALLAQGQLDNLDEYLNLLQSVQLPFAVLPIIRFTSSAAIMGSFVNNMFTQGAAWFCVLLVMIINVYGLTLQGFSTAVVVFGALFYCIVVVFIGVSKVHGLSAQNEFAAKDEVDVVETVDDRTPILTSTQAARAP